MTFLFAVLTPEIPDNELLKQEVDQFSLLEWKNRERRAGIIGNPLMNKPRETLCIVWTLNKAANYPVCARLIAVFQVSTDEKLIFPFLC